MILMRSISYAEAYLESSFARNDSFAGHTVRKCQIFSFFVQQAECGKEFGCVRQAAGASMC